MKSKKHDFSDLVRIKKKRAKRLGVSLTDPKVNEVLAKVNSANENTAGAEVVFDHTIYGMLPKERESPLGEVLKDLLKQDPGLDQHRAKLALKKLDRCKYSDESRYQLFIEPKEPGQYLQDDPYKEYVWSGFPKALSEAKTKK